MAYLSPVSSNELISDLFYVVQETSTALNHSWAQDRNNMWETWQKNCTALRLSDILHKIDDPVPFLKIFSCRYQDGQICRSGAAVWSRTVEEAIRAIGHIFILLVNKNPRLNSFGNVDERISCQLDQWIKEDPAPTCVNPLMFSLLHYIDSVDLNLGTEPQLDLAGMVWISVYFICRPGKYTSATEVSTPFRFKDAAIWIGSQRLNIQTVT